MAGTSSAEISLSGTISIADDYIISGIPVKEALAGEYNIFPVPASNILNFYTPSNDSKTSIEIYDLNGRKLDAFLLNGNSGTYNCAGLNNGIYFCRFITGEKVFSKKIIIEK